MREVPVFSDRADERRGVLASYGDVTPQLTKSSVTIRDGIVAAVAIASMWGMQVATQYGLKSDVRDLLTKLEAYQRSQENTNSSVQREIDDLARKEALDGVRLEETRVIIAEIKGFMTASGMKVPEK